MTRIIIEHNGRRYRIGTSAGCNCKRDCDLFVGGVCNSDTEGVKRLPCDAIADAFIAGGGCCPNYGYKEIKAK